MFFWNLVFDPEVADPDVLTIGRKFNFHTENDGLEKVVPLKCGYVDAIFSIETLNFGAVVFIHKLPTCSKRKVPKTPKV